MKTFTRGNTVYEDLGNGTLVAIGEVEPSGSSVSSAPMLAEDSAALRGLPGDVVHVLTPYTEADPMGLLLNTLIEFGSMVGQAAEVRVGFAHHPPALFGALVGRTSRSRKGTATTEIGGLMRQVEDGWHKGNQVSGFGSGEGFIDHAASNPGQSIYLVETELARVLAVASREGATISSVFRAAWDFRPMELRLRGKKYEADAAPVSLIAHITMDELRDSRHGLRLVEIMNGFGNRILWCYVDRRRLIDSPEPIPNSELTPLLMRLRVALNAARSAGLVGRTPEASLLWSSLYERLNDDVAPGIVDPLIARAEAQLLRLSLIYALMDGSSVVDACHLESAWEVWRYCRWSAQHVFVGSGTGDPDLDRIAAVLDAGDDLSGRDLDRMFLGHRNIPELRRLALEMGIAEEETRVTGGRPSTLLRAAEKAEKAEKGLYWWRTPAYRSTAASGVGTRLSRSDPLSASSALSAPDAQQEEEVVPGQEELERQAQYLRAWNAAVYREAAEREAGAEAKARDVTEAGPADSAPEQQRFPGPDG